VGGGGGIFEHDSAVLGGGGMGEQLSSAWLGGGGMAEHDSLVVGGNGIADRESSVLGAVGMAEHDSAVVGATGIAEQSRVVLGGGGMAEHETAVLGGGGILVQDSTVLGGGGMTDPGSITPMLRPAARPDKTRPRSHVSGQLGCPHNDPGPVAAEQVTGKLQRLPGPGVGGPLHQHQRSTLGHL
jgi:hypothetical protein